MSDTDNELEREDETVKNILNFTTAKYLTLFLLVILIVGFIISFIDYKKAADKGQHVSYFWVELNIPKGYPDTVYQDKIIYVDSSAMIRDTSGVTAINEAGAVQPPQPSAPPPVPALVKVAQPTQTAATEPALPKENPRPRRQANNAPQPPDEPHHLNEDDKTAIISQIEGLKRGGFVTSDEIEIGHIYHSNAGDFIPELIEFLKSKGYKPDDGTRMLLGHTNRKGWWIAVKQDLHKATIGIGMLESGAAK